jgi:Phytanoyl-CoA dioxygenase (PhyH)
MLREHFSQHGYVRIERAFAPAAMADALWAELERRHGIVRGRPETWTVVEPRGLGALRRGGAFDGLATAAVVAAIDELLGAGWPAPFSWGDPLVTFPRPADRPSEQPAERPSERPAERLGDRPAERPSERRGERSAERPAERPGERPGEWRPPTTGWHIDFPARSTLRLKWLGYLEPVGPGGGGTVIAAGSHHRVAEYLRTADPADPGRSAAIRDKVLGGDPIELTGEPGDVVFLHPHLFHAPAANHSAAPRLMVTGGLAG